MNDVSNNVRATIEAFLEAVKALPGKGSAGTPMGIYHIAMAAGRPGLNGFAPFAGSAVGSKRWVPGAILAGDSVEPEMKTGGIGFGVANNGGSMRAGCVVGDARGVGLAPNVEGSVAASYRAVVAQARGDAAAGMARRAAERAALYLPARQMPLTAETFVPPPGSDPGDGVLLQPRARGGASVAALRRRAGSSGLAVVAEPAPAPQSEVEEQQYRATPQSAPVPLTPFDVERALDDYFFRKSRLPPAGGAGFNPLLSPVWAGLKIPG